MPRTAQMAQVGKRKIELSNLGKVLWPADGVLKAELIQHYLGIAPTILAHIRGRPLSLVRYPDGIDGESFFQKNRPKYTPEWMDHERLGDDEAEKKRIDYVIASEEASLVWLANHAAIELHHIHSRRPHFDKPDYVVFDLDPPEGYPFVDVVDLAFQLKEHLEAFGYHCFCKTTGNKGIHVVVPLEPRYDFGTVFETAKALAQPFVRARRDSTTLEIRKEKRPDKVLIDVYRNRPAQTIVAPYSLRGSPGAPVSMPLTWEELEHLQNPRVHNIYTARDTVLERGDPWETIGAYAVRLHTDREAPAQKRDVGTSRTHKTPEQLTEYEKKRSFDRTPEPGPELEIGNGNAFVVHRHHASRLHYDLRLEKDGALRSWAVPRGLPPVPGVKRLAVNVEDHPLEYLTFEGEIPRGEYGAGPMWVYALGNYVVTKDKRDDSFYFRLQSKQVTAEYRLINTKGKDWLLERVDEPQQRWLEAEIEPMLAESQAEVPVGGEWLYEVKWDGIRAIITVDDGQVRIRTRTQRDVTAHFPELCLPEQAFYASTAVFDGEIVCLDGAGKPIFTDVMGRIHARGERGIARAQGRHPAVCYLFDCLYLDGRPIVNEPLERRRAWLTDAVRSGQTDYRVSEAVDDGEALFEASKAVGLEGIVAKERGAVYVPGRRSAAWRKIKVRNTLECLVAGYTQGKGDRSRTFGALHLAQPPEGGGSPEGGLRYLGKVGGGFDGRSLKEVLGLLEELPEVDRPIDEKPVDDAESVWVEPRLWCEVQYASFTNMGTLREPVFLRMRPDLTAAS
jgi:bifunctional non-homologous end joining protein LigD